MAQAGLQPGRCGAVQRRILSLRRHIQIITGAKAETHVPLIGASRLKRAAFLITPCRAGSRRTAVTLSHVSRAPVSHALSRFVTLCALVAQVPRPCRVGSHVLSRLVSHVLSRFFTRVLFTLEPLSRFVTPALRSTSLCLTTFFSHPSRRGLVARVPRPCRVVSHMLSRLVIRDAVSHVLSRFVTFCHVCPVYFRTAVTFCHARVAQHVSVSHYILLTPVTSWPRRASATPVSCGKSRVVTPCHP